MIASLTQIVDAHRFLARRYGLLHEPDPAILDLARQEAIRLSLDEESEPAALFFAFARRARALGDSWRLLPDLLALNQARLLGRPLSLKPEELRRLRVEIASRQVTFEQVRDRFAASL